MPRHGMAQRLPWAGGLACTFLLVLASSCSTGTESSPVSDGRTIGTPTYYDDIAPLVNQHCAKCHYTGGIGPFPLTTYEETAKMADAMVAETAARTMPPWTAQNTDECTPPFPWRDDERLTLDEIDLVRRWAAGGALAGAVPATPVPGPDFASMTLANATYDLTPRTPYTPVATALQDDFRCFVVDAPPELVANGGWVSGIDVLPSNPAIVHHATVWADIGGIEASKAGPDGSWPCSTGMVPLPTDTGEVPNLTWLLSWSPGAKPLVLPEGVAIQIQPQSQIVVQVHYSTGGKVVAPDQSHIRIQMAASAPQYNLLNWGLGNYNYPTPSGDGLQPGPDDPPGVVEFKVPARASSHTETMIATEGDANPIILYGVRGHAHLSANDIKVDVIHDGVDTCMLQDKWDFHWQRSYAFDTTLDTLPRIQPGDRVKIRCTYDNTMNNLRLGNELLARGLQPMDMPLGEDTLDEMCQADLLYLEKVDDQVSHH